MTIAVLGGTGPEGLGLAARLAAAGHEVVVGSRLTERAVAAAATLGPEVPAGRVRGAVNCDAAEAAEILVVAVPLKGLGDLFAACATAVEGKIVLEVVNALRVEAGVFRAVHPEEGSVGARIAARVPSARVVSGLKHVSAANLRAIGRRLEGDVLLCGDDDAAKGVVADLVRGMPDLRPIDAGGLTMAPLLDDVTALLLNLNRRHGTETSLRIVGL